MEQDARNGGEEDEPDGVDFFQLGHQVGACEDGQGQDGGLPAQGSLADLVNGVHPQNGKQHNVHSGGADQGHRGRAQTVQSGIHELTVPEALEEITDDENHHNAGENQPQGGHNGPHHAHACAPQLLAAHGVAHIGGHVYAQGAGGALGYGNHIRQLAGGVPAGFGGNVLEEGNGGHAAANGEEAGFEELPE